MDSWSLGGVVDQADKGSKYYAELHKLMHVYADLYNSPKKSLVFDFTSNLSPFYLLICPYRVRRSTLHRFYDWESLGSIPSVELRYSPKSQPPNYCLPQKHADRI